MTTSGLPKTIEGELDDIRGLIDQYGEAMFSCGDWRTNDDEHDDEDSDYLAVSGQVARKALFDALDVLGAQLAEYRELLTPANVRAIHASLDVSASDEEEPFPGIWAALGAMRKFVGLCPECGRNMTRGELHTSECSIAEAMDQGRPDAADETVIENHCEVCGEYLSECTCLEGGDPTL